jgi:hypothetical protein
MDLHVYRALRAAQPSDLLRAVNDPEEDLYEVVWNLFDELVVEPAEVFDTDFGEKNQFRLVANRHFVMEFLPHAVYYSRRFLLNPVETASEQGGLQLQLQVFPSHSCLFSVGLQIWGPDELGAFVTLWTRHRRLLRLLLDKVKPTIFHWLPGAAVDHADNLEQLIENCLNTPNPENYLAFRYAFARADEDEAPQDFMMVMSLLYFSLRSVVEDEGDILLDGFDRLKGFYRSRLPDLPPPLPCVEITINQDAD